nr:DUF6602 domain-containing protein [Plesiomonas shigelloides]
MNLLVEHFNGIELLLLAKSKIAGNSGHSLHKGNAREDFIRDFLFNHIGNTVRIGTGEIISSSSLVNEPRNQFDVVIYNATFPKINYSSSVDAFLVESVNTTIEVKSTLDKDGLRKAVNAARVVKRLERNVKRPINPQQTVMPRVYNYLVAYSCKASMETIYKWWREIDNEIGINQQDMPCDTQQRHAAVSESLDFIVVLGKGAIYFDNLPVGNSITDKQKKEHPSYRRIIRKQKENNVYLLFLHLIEQAKGIEFDQIDLYSYYSKLNNVFEKETVWEE